MKTRRLFQVASGMLSLVFAVALLVIGILVLLPFVSDGEPIEFVAELCTGVINLVAETEFLQMSGTTGEMLYTLVAYVVPALMLVAAAAIFLTKPKKIKKNPNVKMKRSEKERLRKKYQIKYKVASAIAIVAAVLFVVLFELNAKNCFGEMAITWMIAAAVAAVLLFALIAVSLIAKLPPLKTKPKAATATTEKTEEKPAEEPEQDGPKTVVFESTVDTVKPQSPFEQESAQPTPQPAPQPTQQTYQQPFAQQPYAPQQPYQPSVQAPYQPPFAEPAPDFAEEEPAPVEVPQPKVVPVPDILSAPVMPTAPVNKSAPDPSSVSDVISQAYGSRKTADISTDDLKVIERLRKQLETGVITQQEYMEQLNVYLHETEEEVKSQVEAAKQAAAAPAPDPTPPAEEVLEEDTSEITEEDKRQREILLKAAEAKATEEKPE